MRRLDPIDWNLTYVNAGHVQPLLLRSSGELPIIWIAAAFQSVCLIQRLTSTPAFVFNQATCWHASQMELPRRRTATEQIWDESEIDKVLYDNRHSSSAELVEKLVQACGRLYGNRRTS